MNKFLKIILIVCLMAVAGLSDALAQDTPPGGVPSAIIPDPIGNSGSAGGTDAIFANRNSGWGATGWTGLGSSFSSGGGTFTSSGGFRVGRNFTSVGNSGSGISVGTNFVGGGTGSYGGFGGAGYNEQINAAACTLLGIPMGSFGALVMIFAGIIAIVSGALGAYKMALSTIVVGAGSWILFPIVQMFFPVQCGF